MSDTLFVCPECGPQDYMLFDAGAILERAFEGVWFILKRNSEGKLCAEWMPQDMDYLEDFNMEKHLKTAVEMAEESPSLVCCPKCKEPLE